MFSGHSLLPCIDIITSFTGRVKTKCICADRHHLGQEVKRPQCYYYYYLPYIEIVVFFSTVLHVNDVDMFYATYVCIFFLFF